MKNFRNLLEYIPVLCVMKIVAHMPRRVLHFFAAIFSRIGSWIPPFGGLVRKNLRVVFPEKSEAELKNMTRRNLESLIMTIGELFWIHERPEKLREIIHLQTDYFKTVEAIRSRPEGQAVILITPHFGNWEFAGLVLAEIAEFPMATVVRTARNPLLDRLISSGRAVRNVKIIHSKGGMVQLTHEIEKGTFAGMLIDQNTRVRNGGIFVDFFGLPCPVSRYPAMIAKKLNARIAVGGVWRNPDHYTFTGQLELLPPVSEFENDAVLTQEIMRRSEAIIRKAPEQYLWMYKRFQHIPPEAPPEIASRYPDYAAVPGESFFDLRKRHPKKK